MYYTMNLFYFQGDKIRDFTGKYGFLLCGLPKALHNLSQGLQTIPPKFVQYDRIKLTLTLNMQARRVQSLQQEVAAAATRLLTAPPRRGGATAKHRLALCIKAVQKSSASERMRSLVFVQNYKKKEPFFQKSALLSQKCDKNVFPLLQGAAT